MIICSYIYFPENDTTSFSMTEKKSIVFISIFFICPLDVWLHDLAIVTNAEISIAVQGSLRGVDSEAFGINTSG